MNDTVLLTRDGSGRDADAQSARTTLNVLDEAMVDALVAHTTALAADDSAARRRAARRAASTSWRAATSARSPASSAKRRPSACEGFSAHDRTRCTRRSSTCTGCRIRSSASVHGAVAGFGLSLMNACDLVVAADDAYFASAYRQIALTPDGGGSWSLPRLVGMRTAMEILLLGERFGAAEALALGHRQPGRAARPELDAATDAIVQSLATGPVLALRNAKRLVRESLGRTLSEQLDAEAVELRGLRRHAPISSRASPPSSRSDRRRFEAGNDATRMKHPLGQDALHHRRSRGIGLAIALRAARDGANVVIAAKTAEPHPKLPGTIYTAAEEIEEAGGKALPFALRHPLRGAGCAPRSSEGRRELRRHRHPGQQRQRDQPHRHARDADEALRSHARGQHARHLPLLAGLHPASAQAGRTRTS